jgi:hypothetical protein
MTSTSTMPLSYSPINVNSMLVFLQTFSQHRYRKMLLDNASLLFDFFLGAVW